MIGLAHYARIMNNYCLCYLGYSEEYLLQLKLLRPYLEREFKGLNIYLACDERSFRILEGEQNVLTLKELTERKSEFCHIRKLGFNGVDHPIEALMAEAGVKKYPVPVKQVDLGYRVCMVTKGNHPTKSMTTPHAIALMNHLRAKYKVEPEVNVGIRGANVVAGVECLEFFQAAHGGIHTILIPTGVGTRLYKNMFPKGEILELAV